MTNNSCKECQFFMRNEHSQHSEGFCVYNPPSAIVHEDCVMSVYPIVDGDLMWCGKFTLCSNSQSEKSE